MAPIGSVLKNSIVFLIVMAVGSYIGAFFFYLGMSDIINETAQYTNLALSFLILFGTLGIGLALSLPNIVGDEMVEF